MVGFQVGLLYLWDRPPDGCGSQPAHVLAEPPVWPRLSRASSPHQDSRLPLLTWIVGTGRKDMEKLKSSYDIHLASTVLGTMSKGRAGKRHITMLLNGPHVNTLSQALKISSVLGGSAIRKRGGKEGFWGGRDGLAPVGWREGSWLLAWKP